MKLLITGAFGNIGKAIIEEAHRHDHEVTVFEVDTKKTCSEAKKFQHKVREVFFGDIRNVEDIKKAVQQTEAVINLAAKFRQPQKSVAN